MIQLNIRNRRNYDSIVISETQLPLFRKIKVNLKRLYFVRTSIAESVRAEQLLNEVLQGVSITEKQKLAYTDYNLLEASRREYLIKQEAFYIGKIRTVLMQLGYFTYEWIDILEDLSLEKIFRTPLNLN